MNLNSVTFEAVRAALAKIQYDGLSAVLQEPCKCSHHEKRWYDGGGGGGDWIHPAERPCACGKFRRSEGEGTVSRFAHWQAADPGALWGALYVLFNNALDLLTRENDPLDDTWDKLAKCGELPPEEIDQAALDVVLRWVKGAS